jgi:hypothetical protein
MEFDCFAALQGYLRGYLLSSLDCEAKTVSNAYSVRARGNSNGGEQGS